MGHDDDARDDANATEPAYGTYSGVKRTRTGECSAGAGGGAAKEGKGAQAAHNHSGARTVADTTRVEHARVAWDEIGGGRGQAGDGKVGEDVGAARAAANAGQAGPSSARAEAGTRVRDDGDVPGGSSTRADDARMSGTEDEEAGDRAARAAITERPAPAGRWRRPDATADDGLGSDGDEMMGDGETLAAKGSVFFKHVPYSP